MQIVEIELIIVIVIVIDKMQVYELKEVATDMAIDK